MLEINVGTRNNFVIVLKSAIDLSEVVVTALGQRKRKWHIQILYDPNNDKIISTFHFAHGIKMQFNLYRGVRSVELPNQSMVEYQGQHCCIPVGFGAGNIREIDPGIALAQNHRVRFYKDPVTNLYTHPVVYVEYNAHEFWPTESWNFYGAPTHNGSGYKFLSNTPPNLGEVESPLNETPAAELILKFNGMWEHFSVTLMHLTVRRFTKTGHGRLRVRYDGD